MPHDDLPPPPMGDAYPPPRFTGLGRAAAFAVWITAAVQFVLFSCCGIYLIALGIAPAQQLRQAFQQAAGRLHTEQAQAMLNQMLAHQNAFRIGGAVVMLVTFALALVLMLAGFGVRRGNRTAITLARVLVWIQTVLMGLLTILSLASLLSGGLPSLVVLVIFGGLLALCIWTLRRLRAAAVAPPPDRHGPGLEPWDQPFSDDL